MLSSFTFVALGGVPVGVRAGWTRSRAVAVVQPWRSAGETRWASRALFVPFFLEGAVFTLFAGRGARRGDFACGADEAPSAVLARVVSRTAELAIRGAFRWSDVAAFARRTRLFVEGASMARFAWDAFSLGGINRLAWIARFAAARSRLGQTFVIARIANGFPAQ